MTLAASRCARQPVVRCASVPWHVRAHALIIHVSISHSRQLRVAVHFNIVQYHRPPSPPVYRHPTLGLIAGA